MKNPGSSGLRLPAPLRWFAPRQDGRTVTEYAMIISFFVFVVVGAFSAIASHIGGTASGISSGLGGGGGTQYDFQTYQANGGSNNGSYSNFVNTYLLNDGLESTGTAPTLASSTTLYNSDFEAAGGAVTLFKSIGNDATGTLNAWTTDSGTPTIAANVVTLPTGSVLHAGNPNWGDMTATVRFVWTTGSTFKLRVHQSDGADFIDGLIFTGTVLYLQKVVAGVNTNGPTAGFAPVNGTAYWLQVSAVGTTYTATVFSDVAGAVGAQIATVSWVIADAVLQNGAIALDNSGTSLTVGGAFANVLKVTGTAPTGWATTPELGVWTSGEPSFAWDKSTSYYGAYSASITIPFAGWGGYWVQTTSTAVTSGQTYLATIEVKGTAGTLFLDTTTAGGQWSTGSLATATSWTANSISYTPASTTTASFQLGAHNVGTIWFDDIALTQSVAPNNILFSTLGTTDSGTLSAWTLSAGSAGSFASNQFSVPAGTTYYSGNPDWTNVTVAVRTKAGGVATHPHRVLLHYTNPSNWIGVYVDPAMASPLALDKRTSSGGYSVVNSSAVSGVVAGSWYWLQVTSTGTTYSVNLLTDFAGRPGVTIATVSGVISDAGLATGTVAVADETGDTDVANAVYGGAFASVFTVQSTLPTGWAVNDVSGEAAWAWSKTSPYQGSYSMSVYNPVAAWSSVLIPNGGGSEQTEVAVGPNTTYKFTVAIYSPAGIAGGTGAYIDLIEWNGASQTKDWGSTAMTPVTFTGGAWQVNSFTIKTGASTNHLSFRPTIIGSGTAYFDYMTVHV